MTLTQRTTRIAAGYSGLWALVFVEATDFAAGWPIDPGVTLLGTFALFQIVRTLGYGVGIGLARTQIAEAEAYQLRTVTEEVAAEREELRESLDESGQHAFDLLADAVKRRNAGESEPHVSGERSE